MVTDRKMISINQKMYNEFLLIISMNQNVKTFKIILQKM